MPLQLLLTYGLCEHGVGFTAKHPALDPHDVALDHGEILLHVLVQAHSLFFLGNLK